MSKIKSSGLYSKRLQIFKKKPFSTLKRTNRLLVFMIPVLFCATILQIITPSLSSAQVANSTAATNFCTSKYPRPNGSTSAGSNTSQYSACVDGYVNGDGQGTVCGKYEDDAFDTACREGFNAKKKAEQNPSNANNPAPPASADTPSSSANPDAGADTDPNDKDAVTCAVEKIGWIVCPIIEQSARMSDNLFQFLADSFLEVDVELTSSTSGTKTAWDQAITLANIAFVIAFVIIIISQVTGAGISNYGIKRMLPRLIVAAIAVNVSFWICQGMVDLSNILGHNIMEALKGIAHNVGPSAFENNQASKVNEANGFLGGLTVAVLAAAAVVWLFLAIMGGTIFIVLITCLVIIIILLMRKAFIILLIVVSPFAFVAYLLPNTEKLFSKWLNMFWQLLLVFPIVALLMGGGQLASAIILNAGSSEVVTDPTPEQEAQLRAEQEACDANDTTQSAVKNNGYEVRCEPKVQNTAVIKEPNGQERVVTKESGAMIGLIAAGVAVAPLLAVWSVMKGALAAAGAIGGKIAGAVQTSGDRFGKKGAGVMKRGSDAAKKRVGENAAAAWQRTQARGLNGDIRRGRFGGRVDRVAGTLARRKAARSAVLNTSKDELDREMTRRTNSREVLSAIPGLTDAGRNRADARAIAAEQKQQAEEIQAAHLVVDNMDTNAAIADAREQINTGNFDSPHLAALLEHLAKVEQTAFMELATNLSQSRVGRETAASRAAAGAMSNMGGFYGGGDVAMMRRGDAFDVTARAQENLEGGSMSANNVASLSNDGVNTLIQLTQGRPQAQARVATAINGMSQDQRGNLSQQKKTNLDGHFGSNLT